MGAFPVSAEGTTTVKYRAYDLVGNTETVRTQLVRARYGRAGHDGRQRPDRRDERDGSDLHFSSPTRRRPSSAACCRRLVERLLVAEELLLARRQHLHVRGARGRPGRQRRRLAGDAHVDGRHDACRHDDHERARRPTRTPPARASPSLASDAGPSFECKLDAGSFGPCGSPKTYAGLTEGSHTFSVRAVDAAGNADPTPAAHTWTVDTTAPDTTIPLTPADPSANTTPTFGFGSSQSPSTYECHLDGGGWTPARPRTRSRRR